MLQFFLIVMVFFSSLASAAIPQQTLVKGQATTIEVDYDIGDVAVATKNIVDFMVSSSRHQMYLNALTPGETTLTVWDAAGQVRDETHVSVVSASLQELAQQAQRVIDGLPGVSIATQGAAVAIEGSVVESEDYDLIESFVRTHPGVRNHVILSTDALSADAARMERAIGVPTIRVRAIENQLVLDGVAYTKHDAARAEEIAKLTDPDVKNLIQVRDLDRRIGSSSMIELDIHMMEIKKGALKKFGVLWAPGSFPQSPSGNVASGGSGEGLLGGLEGAGKNLIGFVVNLLPKLQLARERGDGRVLEHSTILVKDGEKGDLFSGTEIPFYRGEKVEFKQVGIAITAEPIAAGDAIDLKMTAKLAAPSASIEGGIDTNSVSTTTICRLGESVVLGNVVRDGDVKMKNRIPKNMDTSTALFSLIASRDFESHRSEFVIFVTPRLVDRGTSAQHNLVRWLETQDDVMRDRSLPEYTTSLTQQGLLPEEAGSSRRPRGDKRWR